MTEHRPVNVKSFVPNETPEQAASAVSDALDFLAQEADAAGMHGIRDLIRRASEMASEFAETMNGLDRDRPRPQ